MSAARMDYEFAGWKANTDAINDHADRIDNYKRYIDRVIKIGVALEKRVAKLEKAKDVAETHADLMETLDKPDPKSWGQRMRTACAYMKKADDDWPHALIAEAEAAMKHEWRPMAAAPRDGRWVLLRYNGDVPRHFLVARAKLDRSWESAHRFTNTDQFDGWLPIPGEDAP